MTRCFFNRGLYEDAFYTKHRIDFYADRTACEEVEYNRELLAEYYNSSFDKISPVTQNELIQNSMIYR